MSHQDSGLYKSFAMVLGALVLFTLFIIVVANVVSPTTDHSRDPLIATATKKQIEPVGRSNVRADDSANAEKAPAATESATGQAATTTAEKTSVEDSTDSATTETATVQTAVVDSGTDAQKDDSATSESATDTASAATQESAAEPARADTSIEIPLKVRAVVATNCAGCHANGVKGAQRNDDAAAWQALADKGLDALTASVINGKGEMPARAESTLDDAELSLAVQHMINKNLGDAGQDGAGQSGAPAKAATMQNDAAAEPAAKADTSAAASTEPAVIPDNVKAAVDTLCAACHISGVGNAPKYGDKEAWDARMANGLDAVTASAIAGKGAMPARGGSQLTDEEIRLAIQYMVAK